MLYSPVCRTYVLGSQFAVLACPLMSWGTAGKNESLPFSSSSKNGSRKQETPELDLCRYWYTRVSVFV